jgi:hypothetical protein
MQTLPDVSPEGGKTKSRTLFQISGARRDVEIDCGLCEGWACLYPVHHILPRQTQIAVHAGAAQALFRGRVTFGYIHGLAGEGRP